MSTNRAFFRKAFRIENCGFTPLTIANIATYLITRCSYFLRSRERHFILVSACINELIKSANIDDDDKESMANDLKPINNLALKKTKPGASKKITDGVKLLETELKAADLSGKNALYLPAFMFILKNY